MKVKELIEKLKEYDGELEVVMEDMDCIRATIEIDTVEKWSDVSTEVETVVIG